MRPGTVRRWWRVSMGAVLFVSACATSPTGRPQVTLVPRQQMAALGDQSFAQMKTEMPQVRDRAMTAYVHCITDALLAQLPEGNAGWDVRVFDRDEVNAFALPGRNIGVFRGLLGVAKTADQLAAVLGHEVGHVLAEHGNERVSQALLVQGGLAALGGMLEDTRGRSVILAALGVGAQVGVLLPHSRAHETEADEIGLELMAKAGFEPRGSVQLWRNMQRASSRQPPEFLSTHPSHRTRIRALELKIPEVMRWYQRAQAEGRGPRCRK